MALHSPLQFKTASTDQEWALSGRTSEGGEARSFPLTSLPFRIGRKSGLSLTLSHSTVSGLHAEFIDLDQTLVLRDLGSTNGTFVNGDRLTAERPLADNDLVQFADLPFRLFRSSQPDRPSCTRSQNSCDQALALVQVDRLFTGKGIVPHYQPIVDFRTRGAIAFEVLARSRLVGLETAAFMFRAAAHLGLAAELSQKLWGAAIDDSWMFPELPHLFLNTHPRELETGKLLESCQELRRIAPQQRITIEIHETAATCVDEMTALRRGLDAIDMTLAFDDFGSGQARIAELAEVRPQYIKFDRSMICNLHLANPSHRHVVEGLVSLVRDLGIVPLAEGVESPEEAEACVDAGFLLAQGYYFGRPLPAVECIASERQGPADSIPAEVQQ
jgi:EAL domain-containing protein (putative c-di-GMP-specific phosphodiesterase class I)